MTFFREKKVWKKNAVDLVLRGGRSRTIHDQEHVRQRLLSLEYKASKSMIQLYELKKQRERNDLPPVTLRIAFAKSAGSIT